MSCCRCTRLRRQLTRPCIETLLCLLQYCIVTIHVELDTDSSSECFVHKRSIPEYGTNIKIFSARPCSFLSSRRLKAGGYPERGFDESRSIDTRGTLPANKRNCLPCQRTLSSTLP